MTRARALCAVIAAGMLAAAAQAEERPSVFRGIVLADSAAGPRVVSVEERSQAAAADLRAGDVIVKIDEHEVRSIDEFAARSQALKGQASSVRLVVFRGGAPREMTVHLFSYPVLKAWGVAFVPAHDIRFAEPQVGLDYWTKLGQGFERAEKPLEALRAYLNALHNVPTHVPTALKVSAILTQVSRQRMSAGELADGVTTLQQSLTILERLFEYPLTTEQLAEIKSQLTDTLAALRAASQTLAK